MNVVRRMLTRNYTKWKLRAWRAVRTRTSAFPSMKRPRINADRRGLMRRQSCEIRDDLRLDSPLISTSSGSEGIERLNEAMGFSLFA